jgi:hypothetical protein
LKVAEKTPVAYGVVAFPVLGEAGYWAKAVTDSAKARMTEPMNFFM